jgi:hypothetical protein
VQEASREGVEWDQHAQQTATVKQGGSAWSGASQANIVNIAHWDGTLVSPPSPPATSSDGMVQAGVTENVRQSLIFGWPFPAAGGLRPGNVFLNGVSAARYVRRVGYPSTVTGSSANAPANPALAAAEGARPSSPADRFVQTLFKLLGAGSSALVLLLGTTPFGALLALFMIAAVGVARSQYVVPALGRSVDFARRERPG